MTARTVHRYVVPVDDEAHDLTTTGLILHVASRDPSVVEVWAEAMEWSPRTIRVQVFGTGQPIPHMAMWLATALAPNGMVWHLYQLVEPPGFAGEAP